MPNSPLGGLLEGLMAGRDQQMRAAQQLADEIFRERQQEESVRERKATQEYQQKSLGLQEKTQTGREMENLFDFGTTLYKEGTPGDAISNILRARAQAAGLDADAVVRGWEALGVSPQFQFKRDAAAAKNELYKDKVFADYVQRTARDLYNSGVPWEAAQAEAERVATSGYLLMREATGEKAGLTPPQPAPAPPVSVPQVQPSPVQATMAPEVDLLKWAGISPPSSPALPPVTGAAVSPPALPVTAPAGGIGVSPKYEAWQRDVESKRLYRDQLGTFLQDKNLRENEKAALQKQMNAANIALKKAQVSYQEAKVRELQNILPEKIKEMQARVGHLVRQDEIATQKLQLQRERQRLDSDLKTGRISGPAVRQRALTTEGVILARKTALQKERMEWEVERGSAEQILAQPPPPDGDAAVMKQRALAQAALGTKGADGRWNGPLQARLDQINAMGKELDQMLQSNRRFLQSNATQREVTPSAKPVHKPKPKPVPGVSTPGSQEFYRGERPNTYLNNKPKMQLGKPGGGDQRTPKRETDADIMARLRKKYR